MMIGYRTQSYSVAAILDKEFKLLICFYWLLTVLTQSSFLHAEELLNLEIQSSIESGFATYQKVKFQGHSSTDLDLLLKRTSSKVNFNPQWFESGELSKKAYDLRDAIVGSAEDGLFPEDYFLNRIEFLWSKSNVPEKAEIDSLLTLAAVRLLSDAKFGRYELRTIDSEAFSKERPEIPDLHPIFNEVLSSRDIYHTISSGFPSHRQYQRMKKALAFYNDILLKGGWGLVAGGQPIKEGTDGERILSLKKRLAISGDLPEKYASGSNFDIDLKVAVKTFQQRHGLPPTGEVHDKTLAELNIPVEKRIESLAINLERWRWLSREFSEERAVFVNIAGFELFGLEGPELKIRLPVIVGKSYHATPVFSDLIEFIEVNPYWNVPSSIASNEILPKLRKNPGYLASEHMRLYRNQDSVGEEVSASSVAWSTTTGRDMGRYSIKQDPGPWNALGNLKFVFPNRYSVYLHDTPNRNLFSQSNRAFSHGCIRVSDPTQLAVFLLDRPQDRWTTSRIDALIATKKNQRIKLPTPIPVHLTYRTAWVDRDNTVNFRSDLYKRDAALALSNRLTK